MGVLEYVISWELPLVGLFVDVNGEETGGIGRSQIVKCGGECHTKSLHQHDELQLSMKGGESVSAWGEWHGEIMVKPVFSGSPSNSR